MPEGLEETSAFAERFVENMTQLGHAVSLVRSKDLFQQGDPANALYVLQAGALEVSVLAEDGRKLILNVLRPGDIFGEIALLDGGPRSATVTASEPSQVVKVDRSAILSRIRSDPDFALHAIAICLNRLRWVNAQLEAHAFQSLDARLARRLLYLREAMGGGDVLSISQAVLAEHVGATREAVAKSLATWKGLGIVSPGRGQITIKDVAALRECARMDSV